MRVAITTLLAVGALATTSAASQAASCQQLWVARNSIYHDAGYCFKTARAIRYFGNAGCTYDRQNDVPLSAAQRRRIASIVEQERLQGCSE